MLFLSLLHLRSSHGKYVRKNREEEVADDRWFLWFDISQVVEQEKNKAYRSSSFVESRSNDKDSKMSKTIAAVSLSARDEYASRTQKFASSRKFIQLHLSIALREQCSLSFAVNERISLRGARSVDFKSHHDLSTVKRSSDCSLSTVICLWLEDFFSLSFILDWLQIISSRIEFVIQESSINVVVVVVSTSISS